MTQIDPTSLAALRERVEALEAALRPFARCAQKYSEAQGGHADSEKVGSGWISLALDLTMGDFRHAAALLAQAGDQRT